MTTRDALSPQVRAAILAAAKRDAAKAPPAKDWQIAVLAPLFANAPRRRSEAA